MLKQRQKDDEEGQLQRGIPTRQSQKPSFLPCFKDPPEKNGETLERGYSVMSFLMWLASWTSAHKRVSSLEERAETIGQGRGWS